LNALNAIRNSYYERICLKKWTSSTVDEIRIRPEGEIIPLKHVLISCLESLPAQNNWEASHREKASWREKVFSFSRIIETLNPFIPVSGEAERTCFTINKSKTHHISGAAAIKTLKTLYLTLALTAPKIKVSLSILGTMENPSGFPKNRATAK